MPFVFNGTTIKQLIFNGVQIEEALLSDGRIVFGAFNIATRTTEASILASSPSNPSGEVTLAYGTDTGNIYIYTNNNWRMILVL